MLILSRKKEQSILIGEEIEIIVVEVSEDKVKLGIRAPKNMSVLRKELLEAVEEENKKSTVSDKVDVSKLTIALGKK